MLVPVLAQEAIPPPSPAAEPAESPEVSEERAEAARWAAGLTDRFARYSGRVVSAHSLSAVAAAICPVNKVLGAQIFRQAIARIDSIPLFDAGMEAGSGAEFSNSRAPLLPAASFTRLWRTTEANALNCDGSLVSAYRKESFEERIGLERTQAKTRLDRAIDVLLLQRRNPAGFTDRSDRAAQLVESALDIAREAKEPAMIDFTSVGRALSMARLFAPEPADRVFRYALEVVSTAPAPRTELLNELGKYLFVAPGMREMPDDDYGSSSSTIGSAEISDFRATRYSANPKLIEAYIDALLLMSETGGINYDPTLAYALAYQLLPKARDMDLARAGELERLLTLLPAANGAQVAASLGGSPADPDSGQPGIQQERLIGLVLREIVRDRASDARRLLVDVTETAARAQLAVLASFAETRSAISDKDWLRAPALVNLMPPGAKRAMLYAGIMANAPRELVFQEAGLEVRDAQALPSEFKLALLCAGSQAMLRTDIEQALSLLAQAVTAANDARARPRQARFDPARRRGIYSAGTSTNTDVSAIALGETTMYEAVDGPVGRHYFDISAPGVSAISLAAAFTAATSADFRRLEAIALGLLDERLQAQSLLAIAGSRLAEEKEQPE